MLGRMAGVLTHTLRRFSWSSTLMPACGDTGLEIEGEDEGEEESSEVTERKEESEESSALRTPSSDPAPPRWSVSVVVGRRRLLIKRLG